MYTKPVQEHMQRGMYAHKAASGIPSSRSDSFEIQIGEKISLER